MERKLTAIAKENFIFNGIDYSKGTKIEGVFEEKQIYQITPLIDIIKNESLSQTTKIANVEEVQLPLEDKKVQVKKIEKTEIKK